jgi:hypothetical protein
VFVDDFSDSSYTDNWTTYTSTGANFTQTGGYAEAQIWSTDDWSSYQYASFFTKGSLDVSQYKTEVVISQCNFNDGIYNRTFLVNTQNPWGKGLVVEHQKYPLGHLRLGLWNNGVTKYLYDSGDMGYYQYDYSVSVVMDPQGNWSFGWANGAGGVAVPLASGTLTASEVTTYLGSPLYLGTGIYNDWNVWGNNVNRTYEVGVYQVPEPVTFVMLCAGGLFLRRNK